MSNFFLSVIYTTIYGMTIMVEFSKKLDKIFSDKSFSKFILTVIQLIVPKVPPVFFRRR